MGISIFKSPKKMTDEQWIEAIADVICKSYGILSKGELIIRRSLFSAAESAPLSYKGFIMQMRRERLAGEDDETYEMRMKITEKICPFYLKKNEWTGEFDMKDEKGLEGLSVGLLKKALKNSYDKNFSRFILLLWIKINLPEAYLFY